MNQHSYEIAAPLAHLDACMDLVEGVPATARLTTRTTDPIDAEIRCVLQEYSPAYVVIDRRHQILRSSGGAERYLEPSPPNGTRLDLLHLVREPLRAVLGSAVQRAVSSSGSLTTELGMIDVEGSKRSIRLTVKPICGTHGAQAMHWVVVFQETAVAGNLRDVQALEQELHTTRGQLCAMINALAASDEELHGLNEEYQSINEELLAVNEELRTIKIEMNSKNELLTHVIDNLKNLLEQTQIATVFLDTQLNITYFTRAMADLFHLREGDHGRPITDLATRLRYTDLHRDVAEVMRTPGIIEREVPTNTEAVFLTRIHPYRSMQGSIDGVVITFIDISDRKRHEAALAQIAAIVDSSQDAIIGHTLDGTITSWNAGAQSIFGYTAAEAIGKPFAILIPEAQGDQAQQVLDRLRQGLRVEHFEVDRVRKDGQTIDVSLSVSAVKDSEGNLNAASTIAREFTQRKLVEDHKSMLMRELDHRMQNTLTVVSSLIRQTARNSESLETFARDIESRLRAFGRVQSLWNHERQGGAALRALVLGELQPYELQRQNRIFVDTGTDIVLSSTATQALAMALHELATNAAKYGALSVPSGKVEVKWRVENLAWEQRVLIDWIERDGPPVRPPTRRGFGSQLIEDMAGRSLNAKVQRDFRPEGVRCRIDFPLIGATDTRAAQRQILE